MDAAELNRAVYAAAPGDVVQALARYLAARRGRTLEAVPDEAALVAWMAEGPENAAGEAAREAAGRLDRVLGESGWSWTWGGWSLPGRGAVTELRAVRAVRGAIAAHRTVAEIHAAWKETRGPHPLAPLVKAWLDRPEAVDIDGRASGIMPEGLFPDWEGGVWEQPEPGLEEMPIPAAPGPAEPERQLALIGGFEDGHGVAPLLTLASAAGFSALKPGAAARLDKRILLFNLLRMPIEQRCPGARWEVREKAWRLVDELWAPTRGGGERLARNSSFRPGKHGRALLQAFGALSHAVVRQADGTLWAPALTRQYPDPRNLNSEYIIEFRLPEGSDHGAMVRRPALVDDGMVSDPAFDLWLSLSYLWDKAKAKNGGVRIYATRPKARRNADGHLLDREGNIIMGAPGSPAKGRDGRLRWPAQGRDGAQAPIGDWRHPAAVIEGTERHPQADKVPCLGPDQRRLMAFGDRERRDKGQQSRDRKTADRLCLRLEGLGRVVIEAPRDHLGVPLARAEWRILEARRGLPGPG